MLISAVNGKCTSCNSPMSLSLLHCRLLAVACSTIVYIFLLLFFSFLNTFSFYYMAMCCYLQNERAFFFKKKKEKYIHEYFFWIKPLELEFQFCICVWQHYLLLPLFLLRNIYMFLNCFKNVHLFGTLRIRICSLSSTRESDL